MYIVFVDNLLMIPPTGGAHTFLVELCAHLVKLGHRVSVITETGPEQSLTRALTESGTEVLTNVWRTVDLPEQRAERLARWVNDRRADVFVVSVSPDAGWLALPLLNREIGTVSITHSDGPTFYRPLQHYRSFVDCAVGVSEETCRQIICQCEVPTERVRHVPYGVKTLTREEMEAHCSSRVDIFRFGYVGRLVQSQKRVLDIIPLAERMLEMDIPFELHIIGDGPERDALEQRLAALMSAGRAKFWGWLSPSGVQDRLRELDALVLLSDCEGLPVALLEAMGHATVPVITALPSGNAEVVEHGRNGFLVPIGDIEAFTDKLELLARDPDRLREMKREAWEKGQRFTVKRMAERYLDCFNVAMTERRSRGLSAQTPQVFPPMSSCVSRYPFWARKLKRRLIVYLDGIRSYPGSSANKDGGQALGV